MKNDTGNYSSTLSPLEKSVQTFIDTAKTAFEEAKENLDTANYLEKYRWTNRYIHDMQIFHLNEFYDYLLEKKDDGEDQNIIALVQRNKFPEKKTIGRYLFRLFKLKMLEFRTIPSNYRHMYHVYWVPYINKDMKEMIIDSYFQKYKEPKQKGKKKVSREEKIVKSIQSEIDNFTSEVVAERILEPLKQKEKERKMKLSAENQKKYLEFQEEAIPKPTTEKIFKEALNQENRKKAQKIIKNTLAQQEREQTEEERKAQGLAILEQLENIGIEIPATQIKRIISSEKKKLLAKQNQKVNLQLSDDSFNDPTDYSEFSEEIVQEGGGS